MNHGLHHLLPQGIRYIARLDSGDTVVRKRFAAQQAYMDANPSCAVVSSFVDFVDAERRHLFRYRAPTDHSGIVRRLRRNNCVMHPGSMIRVSALKQAGIYREDIPGAEDYELFLRLAQRYTLAVLPEVLTHMEYALNGTEHRRPAPSAMAALEIAVALLRSRFTRIVSDGVACTLLTMAIPHDSALQLKRAYLR